MGVNNYRNCNITHNNCLAFQCSGHVYPVCHPIGVLHLGADHILRYQRGEHLLRADKCHARCVYPAAVYSNAKAPDDPPAMVVWRPRQFGC